MLPSFLNPAAFALLATLVMPIILHLRRPPARMVDFAATRWLEPAGSSRRARQLEDMLLLVSRLLLLTLLALWLAHPIVQDRPLRGDWLLVAPGAVVPPTDGYDERRWIAPGFPAIEDAVPVPAADMDTLIREADAMLAPDARLTIVVPQTIWNAGAGRLALAHKAVWRADGQVKPPAVAQRAMPRAAIRHDADHAVDAAILRAALAAWPEMGRPAMSSVAPAQAPLTHDAGLLLWIAATPPPPTMLAAVRNGATLLTQGAGRSPMAGIPVLADADGTILFTERRYGRGRIIDMPLRPSDPRFAMVAEADFPSQLRAILLPASRPQAGTAVDRAPTHASARWTAPDLDLRPWIALALAACLLVERLLACAADRRRRA